MRFVKHTRDNRWRQALRCLLVVVVAAGQSPLPWWHSCHGSHDDATLSGETWLDLHLRSCHAKALAHGTLDIGVHVHFDWPGGDDESSDPSAPTKRRVDLVNDFTAADELHRQHASLLWSEGYAGHVFVSFPEDAGAEAVRRTFMAVFSFFEHYAPDMPLPVRLGVMRC